MYKGRPKLRKILKSMLECALVIVGGLCTCSCGLKYINPDLAEDSEWRKIASSKNTHSRKPKSKKVHKPTESEPTERIIREEKKTTVAPRTRPKEKKKKGLRPEQLIDPVTSLQLRIQENDLWLVAQAITRNLVLVTNDRKSLKPLLEAAGDELTVENWAAGTMWRN